MCCLLIWVEEVWIAKKDFACFPVDSWGGGQIGWAGQKSCYVTAGEREDEVWTHVGPGILTQSDHQSHLFKTSVSIYIKTN